MSSEIENNALVKAHSGLACRDVATVMPQQLPAIKRLSKQEQKKVDEEEGIPSTVERNGDLPGRSISLRQMLLSSVFAMLSFMVLWWTVPWSHFFKGSLPRVGDGLSTALSSEERGRLPNEVLKVMEDVNRLCDEGRPNELLAVCRSRLASLSDDQVRSRDWSPLRRVYFKTLYDQKMSDELGRECAKREEQDQDDVCAIYYGVKVDLDEVKERIDGKTNKNEKEQIDISLDKLKEKCRARLNALQFCSTSESDKCEMSDKDNFRLLLSDVLFQRWRIWKSFNNKELEILSSAISELREIKKRSDLTVRQELNIWEAVYDAWPWHWHWGKYRIDGRELKKADVNQKIEELHKERRR